MVVIPNSKITVLGGGISSMFVLRLSLRIQQQLLIPTLSFVDPLAQNRSQAMEIDSIGAAVINCEMNFFHDVWSVNPVDVKFVRKTTFDFQRFFPRSIAAFSEIAFVRSIKRVHFEVSQLERGEPIELEGYSIAFKNSSHKILGDLEGDLRKKLGKYFMSRP